MEFKISPAIKPEGKLNTLIKKATDPAASLVSVLRIVPNSTTNETTVQAIAILLDFKGMVVRGDGICEA